MVYFSGKDSHANYIVFVKLKQTMDKQAFMKQLAKELHKPVTRKFRRKKVRLAGVDDTWGMDLVDMSEWHPKMMASNLC
jgi:hypothetical protein